MIDHASVEAFVEKKVEYYVEKWTTFADGTSSRVHWNWAAAIGGIAWLFYRKLYLPIAIVLLIGLVDAYITVELEDAEVFPVAVALWDKLSYWVYSAVFGSWGNYWYYQKFRKTSEAVAEISADSSERLSYLAEKGGTSILIPGIVLLALSAVLIWAYTDV